MQGISSPLLDNEATRRVAVALNETVMGEAARRLTLDSNPAAFFVLLHDPASDRG